MKKPVKIAIVDGQPLFRKGVADTLAGPTRIIVGEGDAASDVVHLVNTTQPDIIMLDLAIGGDAIAAIEAVCQQASSTIVAVLTTSDRDRELSEALRAGALGYLLKSITGEELIEAVEILLRGEPYITRSLASLMLTRSKGRPFGHQVVQLGLNNMEILILRHLTMNLNNLEIAQKTGLSLSAVKHRVSRIMRKLGVKRRAQAASRGETLDIFRTRLAANAQAPVCLLGAFNGALCPTCSLRRLDFAVSFYVGRAGCVVH